MTASAQRTQQSDAAEIRQRLRAAGLTTVSIAELAALRAVAREAANGVPLLDLPTVRERLWDALEQLRRAVAGLPPHPGILTPSLLGEMRAVEARIALRRRTPGTHR